MIYQTPSIGDAEASALAATDRLRRDLRLYIGEPRRWVGSVRRVLSARAIQGSNSIEGHHVSVEDAIAALDGDEPTEANLVDRQAVEGYRRALTYVLQLSADVHFDYSAALIRSLHFMMTEYQMSASPGRWRPGPIWVRNDSSGDVVYVAPEAETIPGLIDELIDQLHSDAETPAIVRGAMAHLNLVMMHPFRDGNGRMSRCVQTMVLAREQILAPEFSSIEEYLGRNTAAYYEILGSVGRGEWRPDGDARPWIRFCLEAHYIQAASVLRRVRESEQIWERIEALAQQHRVPDRSIAALFDASLGLRIRNSGYRSLLRQQWAQEISNQAASNDLRALVNAGLLTQTGAKRGTTYSAAPTVRAIRTEIVRKRTPISAAGIFDGDRPALF